MPGYLDLTLFTILSINTVLRSKMMESGFHFGVGSPRLLVRKVSVFVTAFLSPEVHKCFSFGGSS